MYSQKFKKISKYVVLTLILISLVACGSANNGESTSTEQGGTVNNAPIELDVWMSAGMGLESYMEEYAAKNGLKLNFTVAKQDDHQNNLTTTLAAGTGAPDIVTIGGPFVETYKLNPDKFHNFLELGADEVKDDYLEFRWNEMLTRDKKFSLGLPTDIGPMAMVYRVDIFEAAGLPTESGKVEELIKTWEDFIEVGMQIKEKTGKALVANVRDDFYSVVVGQGTELYYDNDDNLIVEQNPQVKKAWDYAVKISEAGLSLNVEYNTAEWGAAQNNGDFAVQLSPYWMIGKIKQNAPETSGKWNVAQMPEGSGNWGGSMVAIPKESKYPKEAYELVKWTLAPEQQLKMFKSANKFPSTPGVFDSPELVDFKDEFLSNAPVGKIYSEAAKRVKPVYYGSYAPQIRDIILKGLDRIEQKNGTSEENWKQSMEDIKNQLARRR